MDNNDLIVIVILYPIKNDLATRHKPHNNIKNGKWECALLGKQSRYTFPYSS